MFLEIPVILFDDEKDCDVEMTIFINPFRVVAIEPIDKSSCQLIMTGEVYYYVPISRRKLNNTLESYIRESVLSKFYKDIKDKEGNN